MHGGGRKLAPSLHLAGKRRNTYTGSKRLITRRSQVQILPLLLRKAPETAPFASQVSGLAFRQVCFFLPQRTADGRVVAAEVLADFAQRVAVAAIGGRDRQLLAREELLERRRL